MAYPYSFWKITFGGELAGSDEIWSCGFHVAAGTSDVDLALQPQAGSAEMTAIWTAIESFYTKAYSRAPRVMRLNWLKVATIGTDGRYMGPPTEHISEVPIAGNSDKAFIPSTAVVYTLAANKFKDPGKYSRFYLPTVPPNGVDAYTEDTGMSLNRAETATALIREINAVFVDLNTAYKVRAVSERVNSYMAITRVRVGNVIDTQRRRRNRLYEQYAEDEV